MSARMNGYSSDRERRPTSEQMADLHVYLIPPDIWREKYHNALNQNINETVSLGFIRVHPEMKIYVLRDEIEQQLGDRDIPREYVFVKSVGRSLTRLKSRQETTLKVKNFLPPQAYAPELYLLEATPEVRQQIAASSENSTRPQTRTSYDYDYMQRQSEELQNAKLSNTSNGADLSSHYYTQLPNITGHPASPQNLNKPIVKKTSATPCDPPTREPINHNVQQYDKQFLSLDGDTNDKQNNDYSDNMSHTNVGHSQQGLRVSHPTSDSAPTLDPPQHHLASSPRRQRPGPQEEYLQPLSATPPHNDSETDKNSKRHHGNHGNQHKHDEDSGIAGFTPETYRENEPLDRRKVDTDENDRLKAPSPQAEDSDRLNRSQDDNDMSDWERRRQEEQERARQEEEERRRREEEQARRDEQEREDIAEQAKLMKSNSDEELRRYPSPPPLRLASPDRDTASARARRRKQKEELLRELEEAREDRRAAERQREELVKNAKQMQTKTQNKRNHARDLWKKRYFEEKKRTGPLEEQCNRLRHELDIIHKKLLTTLEGPREKATKLNDIKPSNKVGSPGKPMVSSDIDTSCTCSPVASPAPNTRGDISKLLDSKGDYSPGQVSPREIASPDLYSGRTKYSSPRMSSRVDSPKRGRKISPNVRGSFPGRARKAESFRERPTPRQGWTEVSSSPRQPTFRGRPPVLTSNGLDKFSNHFIKAKKDHQQYPVSLVGSNRKQAYFESEQFDSDYDSKRSSARSILATKSPDRLDGTPRKNNNFKVQATRLQHEIEDIRRRVDHAKMKLTSEMKLRNQAETELRALRAELTQKKINLTLSRNSHLTTYAPPAADVNLISARAGITPR